MGDISSSLKILDSLPDLKITPDSFTFGTIIEFYSRNGDLDNSLKYFKVMSSHDIKPDVVIYTLIMNAFSTVKTIDFRPSIEDLKIVIDSAVGIGKLIIAANLRRKMEMLQQ